MLYDFHFSQAALTGITFLSVMTYLPVTLIIQCDRQIQYPGLNSKAALNIEYLAILARLLQQINRTQPERDPDKQKYKTNLNAHKVIRQMGHMR